MRRKAILLALLFSLSAVAGCGSSGVPVQDNVTTMDNRSDEDVPVSNEDIESAQSSKDMLIVNNEEGTTIKIPQSYDAGIGCPVERVIAMLKNVSASPNVVIEVTDHNVKIGEDNPDYVEDIIHFNYSYTNSYGYSINMDMSLLTNNFEWKKVIIFKDGVPTYDFSGLEKSDFQCLFDVGDAIWIFQLSGDVRENARNRGISEVVCNINFVNTKSLKYTDSLAGNHSGACFNCYENIIHVSCELLGEKLAKDIRVDTVDFEPYYATLSFDNSAAVRLAMFDDNNTDVHNIMPKNVETTLNTSDSLSEAVSIQDSNDGDIMESSPSLSQNEINSEENQPEQSYNPIYKQGGYMLNEDSEPIEIAIWTDHEDADGCLITYDFFLDNGGFHNIKKISDNEYQFIDNPGITLEFEYFDDYNAPINIWLGTESNTPVGHFNGYHTVTILNNGANIGTFKQFSVTVNSMSDVSN